MAIQRKRRRWFYWGAAGVLAVAALALARPVFYLVRSAWRDQDELEALPLSWVDDASRMNQAQAEVLHVPRDPRAAERQLAQLLRRAQDEGLKVSIAGARHTMGGHTISPDGLQIDMMPLAGMELDEASGILHVAAGARWAEVIPYLDRRGRSVAVMQSNNSFTIGGSISANCHGWQHNHPPIAATVEAFRLMQPDGTVLRSSRAENTELFSLALGGYGLFGIILDVDLRTVPNQRYRLDQVILPTTEYVATFDRKVNRASDAAMAYGRLCVVPEHFLDEAILNVFYGEPAGDEPLPPLSEPGLTSIQRTIFRGSADDDYGKKLRWDAEKRLQQRVAGRYFSRNQLLNEGVEIYQNRSAETTDILHEYFVPPERFLKFVGDMRRIIPRHQGNLLNVTVRNVYTDDDSYLRYADQEMFALVLLFNQRRTLEADHRAEPMTQELIDAALAVGGRYYLPYRLHTTPQQFHRAYPQAQEFFALKRKYDPNELFQNQFYTKYGGTGRAAIGP